MQYIESNRYRKEHEIYYKQLLELTKSLVSIYPNFVQWLIKYMYELSHTTERKYSFAVDNSKLAGISLLKDTEVEKKICCFSVSPLYNNVGIESILLDNSIRLLKIENPEIQILERNMKIMEQILQKHNYRLIKKIPGFQKDSVLVYGR